MDGQSKDCVSHLLIQDSTRSAFQVNCRYWEESFNLTRRLPEAVCSSDTFALRRRDVMEMEGGKDGRELGMVGIYLNGSQSVVDAV